jgi:putative addiction module CopG family antidote
MTELLPADLQQFVHDAVANGHYRDETQLMTRAVRLLRERDAEHERIRAMVQKGIAEIERGEYDEVAVEDLGKYFADIIAEVDRENAERLGKAS